MNQPNQQAEAREALEIAIAAVSVGSLKSDALLRACGTAIDAYRDTIVAGMTAKYEAPETVAQVERAIVRAARGGEHLGPVPWRAMALAALAALSGAGVLHPETDSTEDQGSSLVT